MAKSKYYIELDGKVSFIEKMGRKTVKSELDSALVLEVLNRAIAEGIGLLYKKTKDKP